MHHYSLCVRQLLILALTGNGILLGSSNSFLIRFVLGERLLYDKWLQSCLGRSGCRWLLGLPVLQFILSLLVLHSGPTSASFAHRRAVLSATLVCRGLDPVRGLDWTRESALVAWNVRYCTYVSILL